MNDINDIFRYVIDNSKIVDVVSNYLGAQSIKKQGKCFVCLCPFHDDKHPSMSIDPSRNIFHCWSCNEKGGPLDFVIKFKHINKKYDALVELAKISNIDIPKTNFVKKSQSIKDKYPKEFEALNKLNDFYKLMLSTPPGIEGKKYLDKRGLNDDIINQFGIGFAPKDSSLSINALKNIYDIPTLENAGILSSSTTLSDRLFNRITFPLKDYNGDIVGFSGRKIESGDNNAKYINYPDTTIFNKGSILYNFDVAKISAKKTKKLYIVEGYMDVIAFYRAGIKEVVAAMGTALSNNQINAIKSLNVEVRMCFDSDNPGKENQIKVTTDLLKNNLNVTCVRPFTNFKDADEIVSSTNGEKLLNELSNRLIDPYLFLLAYYLDGQKELTDTTKINNFINESKYFFLRLNKINQSKDLDILSKVSNIDKTDLISLYKEETTFRSTIKKDVQNYSNNQTHYISNFKKQYSENNEITKKLSKNFDPNKKDISREKIKNFSKDNSFKEYNITEQEYYLEVELIISCFYSNLSIKIIGENKFIFSFSPFNSLLMLIQLGYENNPEKNNIDSNIFEMITKNIFGENNVENEFDGIDVSDMNLDYVVNVKDKDFLQNYIEYFSDFTINEDDFSSNNFNALIKKINDLRKRLNK